MNHSLLKLQYILELNNVFYIPNISRNFISVSRLAVFDYKFLFENKMSIFRNNYFVGSDPMVHNLYKLDLSPNFEYNYLCLNVTASIKKRPCK